MFAAQTKTSTTRKSFGQRMVFALLDRFTEARIKSQLLTFPFTF